MKITVIHGTMRQESTWHCWDIIKQELAKSGELVVEEFFLPRDMPYFCQGCFSCFSKGENTCPHAEVIQPLAEAMLRADVVVLTSPVYAMDVSGQMKALLDHFSYMWMSHRPHPRMFDKIGLVLTTAAGSGLSHTQKTMKNSLRFWGMKRILAYAAPSNAMRWSDIPPKRLAKMLKTLHRRAAKVAVWVEKADRLPNPPIRTMLFLLMRAMQKRNTWNETDRQYWQAQGWLCGKKPF